MTTLDMENRTLLNVRYAAKEGLLRSTTLSLKAWVAVTVKKRSGLTILTTWLHYVGNAMMMHTMVN